MNQIRHDVLYLLFAFRPDTRGLIVFKELDMNDIRVAADGAILDVLLFGTSATIDRNDNALAAGWADIRPLIPGSRALPFSALVHGRSIPTIRCQVQGQWRSLK